jgi:hypothetical protein
VMGLVIEEVQQQAAERLAERGATRVAVSQHVVQICCRYLAASAMMIPSIRSRCTRSSGRLSPYD